MQTRQFQRRNSRRRQKTQAKTFSPKNSMTQSVLEVLDGTLDADGHLKTLLDEESLASKTSTVNLASFSLVENLKRDIGSPR